MRFPSALALCAAISMAALPALAQNYNPLARPGAAPGLPGAPAKPAEEGNPDLGGLPDGKGAEETFYACAACHSTAIIKQQHISDGRWDDLWGWMITEQGMPEYPPEEKDLILNYLKTHFSSER
ncbi:MAG: cytochrome C-552 [Alphaproteobacteria bacterium]|nr:cytochrome C-552 [Alphaproteobacteria bacterium]MBU0796839.1 cytochrome C-552 [Alphaproteobacteria bacterium]MBU0885803.1 cytochrome C-552 [Alphaproteobacteria bacterium]MBU1812120.1 cytochrome C-552 [Alphaproteobacteria bacterium]MBU2091646.1 cytochrome C-552 [Alphaproteobacteria bacterium]